jgi:hypothetical protein
MASPIAITAKRTHRKLLEVCGMTIFINMICWLTGIAAGFQS